MADQKQLPRGTAATHVLGGYYHNPLMIDISKRKINLIEKETELLKRLKDLQYELNSVTNQLEVIEAYQNGETNLYWL